MARVKWERRASQQYEQLTDDQKRAAITMQNKLRDDPSIGYPSHEVELEDGTTAYVRTFPGLTVTLGFYRTGFLWLNLLIVIISVEPTEERWMSTDDYEQREIDRGPRRGRKR